MSNQRLTLNADDASKSVRKIKEEVETVARAANVFKSQVSAVYETSNLTFLQTISTAMGEIETNTRSLVNDCDAIFHVLQKYVGDMAEYSSDTNGLYRD